MRRFLGMTLLTLASAAALYPEALDAQDRSSRGRWSVSTSLTFPLVRIYQVYVNYRIDDRNEVSMGPAFQNFRHESFTSNAYTLILGYRRYLTDQVSVEAEIYPAYNRMYSHVTESHHPGWELWAEAKVGYTWDLADERFFLHPAPGIGFGIFQSNPPPGFDQEIDSPVFVPQLLMGVRF
jgi:hypothetical protein